VVVTVKQFTKIRNIAIAARKPAKNIDMKICATRYNLIVYVTMAE